MSDIVERAKAALAGTTAGPWGTDGELIASELTVDGPGVTSYKHAVAEMETDYYAEEDAADGETYGDDEPWRSYDQLRADAEFIAAARTLVPELVAEVEKLTVLLAANEIYTHEGARTWFRSKNKHLEGQSPDELVKAGETQRVMDYITFLAEGNFA